MFAMPKPGTPKKGFQLRTPQGTEPAVRTWEEAPANVRRAFRLLAQASERRGAIKQ